MTSDAVGAQCTWATSASSSRWLRSIPMTGVMPLPAVRKRTFAGAGLGRVKSPVAWSSMTRVPGARGPDQVVGDLAVGDRLGRDGDAARRDAGRGRAVGAVGEAVGAPVAHAVDVDADPDVLPGHVAEPAATGPDDDRHGVRRSRGAPRRCGRAGRRRSAAGRSGRGSPRARAGWRGPRPPCGHAHAHREVRGRGLRGAGAPARARGCGRGAGSVGSTVGALTYASVTYATVTYETVTTPAPSRPQLSRPMREPSRFAPHPFRLLR